MPEHPTREHAGRVARLWRSSAVRYLVVGSVAFGFDVGLLFVLREVVGIPLGISTAAAFLISFVVTYLLQRVFTFESRNRMASSAFRYTLLVIANTFAVTAIVSIAAACGLPWLAGKVISAIAMTVWNYFAYRYWVFADGSLHASEGSASQT